MIQTTMNIINKFLLLCFLHCFLCNIANAQTWDDNEMPLRCALTVFATPNQEFMHKIVTKPNHRVDFVLFYEKELREGLVYCADRLSTGNKYGFIHGTAPQKEGIYNYDIFVSDTITNSRCRVPITFIVSNHLQSPTPMMGWLSWNWFESWAEESVLIENARGMKDCGLQNTGYQYIILDDKWANPGTSKAKLDYDRKKFQSMNHPDYGFTSRLHHMGYYVGIYSDAGSATCANRYQAGSYGYERDRKSVV